MDLPKGIRLRADSLCIDFSYRGVRCRETLKGLAPTKANIKFAANKRATILHEIAIGTFDYARHFPDSPRATQSSRVTDRTVEEAVTMHLDICKTMMATSTHLNYQVKANYITLYFTGQRSLTTITRTDIETFQVTLLKEGKAPKTVNDTFTVLRAVFDRALADGVLHSNPAASVRNVKRDLREEAEPDPYTLSELQRIGSLQFREEVINMFMFTCWTGLSLSEVLALAWEDIDTKQWRMRIRRARVGLEYKAPKEKSRVREIELIPQAIEWLKAQQRFTAMRPLTEFSVTQWNNVSTRKEQLRIVFLDGDKEWSPKLQRNAYRAMLRKAGIRYRSPNQCRHTFASQLLSHFVPMEIIARQMGHSDTTMIKLHYGKWIPSDTPNVAALISQHLGNCHKGVTEKAVNDVTD